MTFTLEVWLVEDWGLAARLHVRCLDGTQRPAFKARFVYGGVAVHGRTFTPTYFFRPVTDDPRGDTIAETDGVITLADPEVPYAAYLRTVPVLSLEEFEGRPSFALTLEHGDDLYQSLDLLVGQSGKGAEISSRVASLQIDDAVTESQDYFAGVLAPYDIVTPLPSIDEGFRHAVLNLEYVYSDPAWLEGVHWWAGYSPNHYQLSAATALGQYERAAKTLRFFGLEPDKHWRWHLCLDSDEVAGTRRYDKANLAAYYALNIVEYLDATGDVALFRDVWPSLARTFEQVWQTRDFDGNGLLSWQFGCNLFLYQADSLALPGDSASPTLMVAGMCKLLSSRASVVGLAQSAETLDQYAAKGLDAARSRLWDPELEVFRGHIDHQGIAHAPHYYTDLVFPTLYTDLPTQYQEGPLRYLERQWTLAGLDQQVRLMRVGDLKPSMFGNDNVMPVQMCEAARAWYRQGRTDLATRMLESVGLAGTVYTDAPGNFPERMSDTGRGEANYVFGPPTGAYLHSVVVGLFGLSLGDSGQTLMWSPGFPASWGRARLRLPYATAELLSDEQGDRRTRTYRVTCDTSRPLQFAAWLHGSEPVTVRLNGDKVPYALESQYGRSRLLLQGPSSLEHEVTITTIGADSGDDLPAPVEPAEPSQGAVLPAGIGAADALDIAAFANTSKMEIVTKWGDDASVQLRMESSVDTAAGPFELVRGPNRLAAVALGRSDRITGITSPVEFAPTLTIPVRRRASSVLLLYANESESRLTGAQVGLIRLCYADGSIDATPLVVGRNVDCLLAHYAAEPVAVPVALADAPWPSGHLDLLA
ncbi:MAG: hypothetical protein IT193_15080, partial [Propionibacteriaceae bacterium]|nr:hypothetical protein [Propionibacteriaceae bacterium]